MADSSVTSASAAATTAAASTAVASIVKTLGSGSGIDTVTLVQQLTDAQFSVKQSQLSKQADTLTSQISAVSTLMSTLTNFDSALKTLVQGGTVTTQPTSSNTGVVTATALSGAKITGFSASLGVQQLASAQAATTNTAIPRTTAFNTGTLTLRLGTYGTTTDSSTTPPTTTTTLDQGSNVPIDITIGTGDATLDGIAKAINAANKGVTATVITDNGGVRLSIRGTTGEAQAFTLKGNDTVVDPAQSSRSLSTLNISANPNDAGDTTIGTTAGDSIVSLDGATFHRATNSISDLITGVKLDLASVSTTNVTLGSTPPTDGLKQSVTDFVDTYNELHKTMASDIDSATGVLKADPFVKAVSNALGKLNTTNLVPASSVAGSPRSLADIGVNVTKDGSLTVNSDRLTAALAKYPDAIEAMFAYGTAGATEDGISGALSAIVKKATVKQSINDQDDTSLNGSTYKYTKAQTTNADAVTKITDQATTYKTNLTNQYSKMDAAVAAYKSTQTFLQQQIDAWSNTKS